MVKEEEMVSLGAQKLVGGGRASCPASVWPVWASRASVAKSLEIIRCLWSLLFLVCEALEVTSQGTPGILPCLDSSLSTEEFL